MALEVWVSGAPRLVWGMLTPRPLPEGKGVRMRNT